MLKMGCRSATIVPDGVLFGTSKAHLALRKMLVDENQLEAVISLPGGVFKPYAGVSTGIIIFTKGGRLITYFITMSRLMASRWMTSGHRCRKTICRT